MRVRQVVSTDGLRRRRYQRLSRLVGLRPTDRVLELGCGGGRRSIADWNHENPITGIDILPPGRVKADQPNFVYRRCDATDLSEFPDGSFDVAISVGMLEHIVPDERLAAAIRETRRVARRYVFVVPHRLAFIEPHYQMPFFPVWPARLQRSWIAWRGERDHPVNWPTDAHWRELFHDPTLRLLNHWYGPLLLYRILLGGTGVPSESTADPDPPTA